MKSNKTFRNKFSKKNCKIYTLKTIKHCRKAKERSHKWGASQVAQCKEPACQCRRCKRHGFNPWFGKIPGVGKWQPTPVFLPEECHGQRGLEGYSPWGHEESDMTEHKAHEHIHEVHFHRLEDLLLKWQCFPSWYRSNTISIQIPAGCCAEIDKLFLKFTWKFKGLFRIAKTISKENRTGGYTLLDLKTYYKATVVKQWGIRTDI